MACPIPRLQMAIEARAIRFGAISGKPSRPANDDFGGKLKAVFGSMGAKKVRRSG